MSLSPPNSTPSPCQPASHRLPNLFSALFSLSQPNRPFPQTCLFLEVKLISSALSGQGTPLPARAWPGVSWLLGAPGFAQPGRSFPGSGLQTQKASSLTSPSLGGFPTQRGQERP